MTRPLLVLIQQAYVLSGMITTGEPADMYREREGVQFPTWRAYALSFGLFIVLLVIGYLAVFVVWREALLAMLSVVLQGRHWSVSRLLYMLGIVALSVSAFIFLMAAEPYLRVGVERHDLRRRFLRLFVPLVLLMIIGMVVRQVLEEIRTP